MALEDEWLKPYRSMEPWNEASLVDFLKKDVDACYAAITHAKWANCLVQLVALAIMVQTVVTLTDVYFTLVRSLPNTRSNEPSVVFADIVLVCIFFAMVTIVASILNGASRIARQFISSTREELHNKVKTIQRAYNSWGGEVPSSVQKLLSGMEKA